MKKKRVIYPDQLLSIDQSIINGSIFQILGDNNIEIISTPTISHDVLKSLSLSLLKNFKPHNLLEEFQFINSKVENQITLLTELKRYVTKIENNKIIKILTEDLLNRANSKQLIFAHGGAGKTHVLWSLGNYLYEKTDFIPIFISLRDFSSIQEIEMYLRGIKKGLSFDILNQNPNIIFLLDGLTEFSRKQQQNSELKKLFGLLTPSKIISTSRSINTISDCENWNLELIHKEQVSEFLANSGFDINIIDNSLLELLSYPLLLILYVTLGGKSASIAELFTEYFNQLSLKIDDKRALHKILSLSAMDMEINNTQMKWELFESKFNIHCELQNKNEYKSLLDKLGVFNKRGTILEPLHDLYWEWLVGCGLFFSWENTKKIVTNNLRIRDKIYLSINSPNISLPKEIDLLEILSLDIIFSSHFYYHVNRKLGYKKFSSNFENELSKKLCSPIKSEKIRAIQASFISNNNIFLEQTLNAINELTANNVSISEVKDFIKPEFLWENKELISEFFSQNQNIYVIKNIIEETQDIKWAKWAENLYLMGNLEFKVATSIHLSCSNDFPEWIESSLLNFLINGNCYHLRTAAKKGGNIKLAYWLYENYTELVSMDNSSGWCDINNILTSCGDQQFFEKISQSFYELSDKAQELILYALEKVEKQWISALQNNLLSRKITQHTKKRIFTAIYQLLNEKTLREWAESSDINISDLGWNALARIHGLEILDELIENLPINFANIHHIPVLRAMATIENLPNHLESILTSRLGSPMMPMATQDYIITMGNIQPYGILNILNLIKRQPFIFGHYHFKIFAESFTKWSKENAIKLIVSDNGNTFNIIEYYLLLQLQKNQTTEWFDLIIEYAENDILFLKIANIIRYHTNSSTDLHNLSIKKYNKSIFDAIKSKFDAITIFNVHENCLDTLPTENLYELTIDILQNHQEAINEFLYRLSSKPNRKYIKTYSEILKLTLNNKLSSQCYFYIAPLLACLNQTQLMNELSLYLNKHQNIIVPIIRQVELLTDNILINESYELID